MKNISPWTICLLIFITRSQEVNAIDNGWIELSVDNSNPVQSANYDDFSITTNRVQLQLTQLRENDDLYFEVKFGFYSEASKSTAKAELTFTLDTRSDLSNKLSLYDVGSFISCESTEPALKSSIPSESTVDLSTDYILETSGGQKGKFSTETGGECPTAWTSFTNNRAAIKKFKIFLENRETAKKLSDHYTVSYRILEACQGGQYLDNNNDGKCKDCQTDYYGAGGWLESCTKCPDKKGVEAGKGKTESDCTWKPCSKGQYLDQTKGCQNCQKDQWSEGGTVASCTNCPDGKEVAEGAGTSQSSCTWKACVAGQYLDQSTGCQDCPTDHWSGAGNTAASCTACPSGREVAAGQGKQESDCTWKACSKGQYLDQTTGCKNCPKNQWSDGGSVASCTNCPANKGVAEGAGTSQDSCTWNPCVAGQYLDQADGCKNCPANHWSAAGNTEASCTACITGKEVAAGQGKQESDCNWTPCSKGQYLDQTKGCENCPIDHWSDGGTVASCTLCPANRGVASGSGTSESSCTWKPCEAGKFLDQTEGCENCPANHWSAVGNTAASCSACPVGKAVAAGQGKQESDCSWIPCSKGQFLDATKGCQNCQQDYWSDGGDVKVCTNCPVNKEVASGAGTSQDSCSWKACNGGQFLDQSSGCQDCSADHWSPVGSKSATCSNCPSGKGVDAGIGKLESDCTWKPCVGGQYLDQEKGCLNCKAGFYSAGGIVNTCTPCPKNQYSGEGATKCTNCPAKTYVLAGKGTKEDDCKEEIVTWTVEKLILVREKAGGMVNGSSEGLLVVTTNNGAESLNVTFCNEGYSNATAKIICSRLGFGDGQFGSNPQNFEYVSESMLKKTSMPILSVEGCSTKYDYTDVTDDCMDKMKKNSCNHDDTVWIKCAEIISDRSTSEHVSPTVILASVFGAAGLFLVVVVGYVVIRSCRRWRR